MYYVIRILSTPRQGARLVDDTLRDALFFRRAPATKYCRAVDAHGDSDRVLVLWARPNACCVHGRTRCKWHRTVGNTGSSPTGTEKASRVGRSSPLPGP